MAFLHDHQELVEEPRVDLVDGVEFADGHPPSESLTNEEQPLRSGDRGLRQEFSGWYVRVVLFGGIAIEPVATLFEGTQTLLDRLGERAPDGHGFTDGLHARAQLPGRTRQLFEGPPRNLRHHVVDHRLEAGVGGLGDVVRDLVEGVADGELRGDFGDGIARGFGGQR